MQFGKLEKYDRKLSNILDMLNEGYSEKELRELVLKENYQLKQEVDRMYIDQLDYIERVFNGSEFTKKTH